MKRIFLYFSFFFLCITQLFASYSASAIYYASDSELESMSRARGLEIQEPEKMRQALYEYEGLDTYSLEENEQSEYSLSIISAKSLERSDGAIVVSGNASISFKSEDIGEKKLSAGRIIVDLDNSQITALENVYLVDDSKNASLNELKADIISIHWKTGELSVSNATTSSERKNSEDESVTFYTTGKKLTYFPSGGIFYEDGYMSSDTENRYSSIKADEIAVLSDGDMFLSNAFLSIGRVPILYVPFFFFPGSRILGNPAFGFDSQKGSFVNTTFEILGSSDEVESSDTSSSFTALFRSIEDDTELVPSGFYYSNDENISKAQAWARNSKSYISLLADVYSGSNRDARLEDGILHFGIDSKINLFEKKLKILIQDGIGLTNAYPKDSIFRYYGINSLSYNDFGLRVDAVFPFYSDDYVLIDFKNRLVGFSLDPILGQDSEFNEKYSSQLTSFNQSIDLSYSLPSKYTNTYLSSFSISSFRTRAIYKWISPNSSYVDDGKRGKFILDEFEKPYFGLSISGSIYETKSEKRVSIDVAETEEIPQSEIHILSDPLLYDLYKENDDKSSSSPNSAYSSSLKYSISETFSNKDSFTYGKLDSESLSSSTSSKLTLSASIGSLFSLSDILTPSYSYSENKSYLNNSSTSVKKTERFTVNNEIITQIPFLGISYTLAVRLVNFEKKNTWLDSIWDSNASEQNDFSPKWDKDTVIKHQIAFSKSFETGIGIFSPSLNYTLKPLNGVLEPKLSYKYKDFASAFSWKFTQDESGKYESDLIGLSLGYTARYFTFSTAFKYMSKDYRKNDFLYPFSMTGSLSIRTDDKKWSITEYMDYSYFKNNKYNYFNNIKTTFASPFGSLDLNWKTQSNNKIEFNDLSLNLNYYSDPIQFWKGRIYLKFGVESSFTMDVKSPENTIFRITPSTIFSIAEFLDMKISFSSYNNNFSSYFVDERFKFNLMLKDLVNSIDFFGNGRYHTNFLLKSASIEFVHYMKDWDLHCTYSTEVVKSSNTYSLIPKFSVYLAWKTLPDLKVDRKWKQENNNGNYQWVED